jgi:hypothetical protein
MATYTVAIRRQPVTITADAIPGGDDVVLNGTLDWNTTGTTVTVDLRLVNTLVTAAEQTLTAGGGNLVVTPGATTSFSFRVPRTFAGATNATKAFAMLRISDGTNIRTWLLVDISYKWRVV